MGQMNAVMMVPFNKRWVNTTCMTAIGRQQAGAKMSVAIKLMTGNFQIFRPGSTHSPLLRVLPLT